MLNCIPLHIGPKRKIPVARAGAVAHHAFGFSPPGRQSILPLLPRRQKNTGLLGLGK
jgi:hypothetical protein